MTLSNRELSRRVLAGARVNVDDAAALFSFPLAELGALATARLRAVQPAPQAGFIIDRIINYTNICGAGCRFCAFHAGAGNVPPYTLSIDEILKKADELAEAGGSQIMLQGGLNPSLGIEHLEMMARAVKERHPGIALHSYSPSEIACAAELAGISDDEAVARLKDAGVDSIPGASDLLVERIRSSVSPNKISVSRWLSVMRSIARCSMQSSATMTYGMGESLRERAEHLNVVRDLQDETGTIRAFIPWSFAPANTELGCDAETLPSTADAYLRTVAVSRIFLDNVKFIQSGWLTEGLDTAAISLAFGVNDMGGVLTEENVVRAAGINNKAGVEQFVRIIREAGLTPVLRDSSYNELRMFD